MKAATIIAWFTLASAAFAGEKIALKAESGLFEIAQEYQGEFIETVRFRDPKISTVGFSGFSWSGVYHLSLDEQSLLRIQKIGSGESRAVLYRIEKNGRVSEVLGFDDLLWRISDAMSGLKKRKLYHTGVDDIAWAKDCDTVEIVLRGSNATKSGDGIKTRLIYDIKGNKVTAKNSPNWGIILLRSELFGTLLPIIMWCILRRF